MKKDRYDREQIESLREWQEEAIQILLLGGIGVAAIALIGVGYELAVRTDNLDLFRTIIVVAVLTAGFWGLREACNKVCA